MNKFYKVIKKNSYSIIIKLNSENDFRIHGIQDKCSTLDKNLIILDKINSKKKIILKDIVINGVLNINLIQGTVYLINVKAYRINIVSKLESFIEIDDKTDVKEIYIWNRQNINIKVNTPNKNLENIYVMPMNKRGKEAGISFEGSIKNCQVTILDGICVHCHKNFENKFIEVCIENNKELRLLGDFSKTKLDILNCKCIIGDENDVPKNLCIYLRIYFSQIVLDGNLTHANIIVEDTMDLVVKCIYLNKVYIRQKTKVGLFFCKNTIIKSFETEGYVVLDGTFETVKNAIKQIFISKNTGRVELNYNNKELRNLKSLMECINKVLLYFIKEIDFDITISHLMSICQDKYVKVYINNLQKLVPESNIFHLNLKKQNIKYNAIEPDFNKIHMQEAVMTIVLSKEGNSICKCIPIRGKYLYMSIDYEYKCIYIQNHFSVLKYVFTQNYLNKIVLMENINVDNFSLYIENKNLDIDLNEKIFLLNNINVLESCVKIENGVIEPTNKIVNWSSVDEDNSSKCFIKIKGSNTDTKLYCENLTIPNIKMDFSYLPQGSTNTILFYAGDNSSFSKVKKIYFRRCSLELKKQNIGNKNNGEPYVLYTFAHENTLFYNNFNESYKCIKVNGCGAFNHINLIMISNDFSNVKEKNNSVLTVVPYSNSKGIIVDDIEFTSNLDETIIENRMKQLLILSCMTSNIFGKGSCMNFWQNQEGKLIKTAIYIDGQWQIFSIPNVIPDNVNNDMKHVICMSFNSNVVWSSNITEIRIINTKDRILESYEYSIDADLGKIYIYNVILNDEKLPIYRGILEPGNNEIIIKSKYFDEVKVNQIIKPIQIVEVVNGIGKAITRVEDLGSKVINFKLIVNTGGLNIGKPIEIYIKP